MARDKAVKGLRPNEKISVSRVRGLKILGMVGKHFFLIIFFFWKNYNFMHFERQNKNIILCILKGISTFKMHKIIYFTRKPEKNSRFHQ